MRRLNHTKARSLRRAMTDAERKLWSALRGRALEGYKFRRQQPIGSYVVDFICLEKRLVIEVDGGQHANNEASDAARTSWLEGEGYCVLRFWNNDVVEHLEGVLEEIRKHLGGPLTRR